MYFKSLEMIGFKSFVDETKVEFEPGITAIVGPNGCGKSNISDAIRWVLGEQSAKLLRGNKMDDFIFNGSEGRKPLNMAEVSLTVTNLKGAVTSAELSPYEEITVTRKLFRSGESEYYINKTPCRLKDIVDVFLDTGLNTRGFSMMEQGQVNKIINSKPDERRFIIEEAAGVMKYKHRRNAAIQKLESSQQNLIRIGDIIGELERQMNSLKRQANKAERYKKYKGEMKELGVRLLSVELKKETEALSSVDTEYTGYKEKEVEASARASSSKNRLESLRTELTVEEKRLAELRQEEFELGSRVERDEEKISLAKGQIEDLHNDDIRAGEEIEELKREIDSLEGQYNNIKSDMEGIQIKVEEQKTLYADSENRLVGMNNEYKEKQSNLEKMDAEIIKIIGEISQNKNTLTSLETRLDFIQKRRERVSIEKTETEEGIKNLNITLEDAVNRLSVTKERLDGLKKNKEELTRQLINLKESLINHEDRVSEIKEKLGTRLSVLKSLEELQKNFEGYEEGVRSVMKSRDSGGLNGVHGVLVDFIETAPEYETAIESVLSERLQGVVVESHDEGMKGVEHLKSQSAGRAQFIPLKLKHHPKTGSGEASSQGRKALEVVRCNEKYKDILECLLSDVLIVNDIEGAVNIWRNNGNSYTIVTLNGEVVDPHGSITGGSKKGNEQGLMQRKRQIAEINIEIDNLKAEFDAVGKERDGIKSEIESLESTIGGIESSIREEEFRLIGEENGLARIRDEIERLKKKIETLDYETNSFDVEIREITVESDKYKNEILKKEEYHGKITGQSNGIKEDMKSLRESLDALIEDTNRLKIDLTALNGKLDSHKREIERIVRGKEDLNLRIEKREEERIGITDKKKEVENSIKRMEDEIYQVSLKRDEKKKEINTREEALREKNESLKIIEEEVKIIEAELSGLRDTLNNLGVKKAELNLRVENLKRRAVEEYNIKDNEIPEVAVEEVNLEEVNNRLEFLRSEIERFGDVNLAAIEEYNSVSERYTFLKTQQDDLVQSIKSLHQTIEKIDSTTRHMFAETFIKVNENFKGIFRRLFGGGRAELVLVDEGNMLETGVDIIVQPPGKRLQNITLLSQGEKAMTAISLLFSIFMVKPSPFCLLDEVDAPLDEANIFRFRDMLKEMCSNTQFLVITHNQKTMSFADSLYGITMEEDGVSKVISVNLTKEALAA
jgi:chromosome segregation protein